jgi:ADP-ribose pyrophosphatase YjhB (NUDIX family)
MIGRSFRAKETTMLKPKAASSAILRRGDALLLVKRKYPPAAEQYAFPGGRAEQGESPEETALREFEEETGIKAHSPRFFKLYDLPNRDENGHLTSHFILSVFTVEADSETVAKAADDALEVGWFTIDAIRQLPTPQSVLECAEQLLLQDQ